LKSYVKIIIGGSIAVVAAIIVIIIMQAAAEEKIAKQQHPCYQMYLQLKEIRNEMVIADRLNPEMLNRFSELGSKWIVENRCGENLEEWADEEIRSEIESFISPLNQSP